PAACGGADLRRPGCRASSRGSGPLWVSARSRAWSSVDERAAVDVDALPVNEACMAGAQERHHVRHILWLAEAADGHLAREVGEALHDVGVDQSRCDGVDGDA